MDKCPPFYRSCVVASFEENPKIKTIFENDCNTFSKRWFNYKREVLDRLKKAISNLSNSDKACLTRNFYRAKINSENQPDARDQDQLYLIDWTSLMQGFHAQENKLMEISNWALSMKQRLDFIDNIPILGKVFKACDRSRQDPLFIPKQVAK